MNDILNVRIVNSVVLVGFTNQNNSKSNEKPFAAESPNNVYKNNSWQNVSCIKKIASAFISTLLPYKFLFLNVYESLKFVCIIRMSIYLILQWISWKNVNKKTVNPSRTMEQQLSEWLTFVQIFLKENLNLQKFLSVFS